MSDDFGTVNVKRGDRAREIEILRQHYREHREALQRMAQEAPSEQLASEYHRLIRSIEASLAKLDDLERVGAAADVTQTDNILRQKTEPGMKPLSGPPAAGVYETSPGTATPQSRMAMIIVAGLLILGIIGALIWYASRDRATHRPVTTETTVVTNDTAAPATTAPQPVAPPPGVSAFTVAPAIADYGQIRKGTRAVRQVEVTNTTGKQLDYTVSRSQCRCLYYDYTGKLGPKKKETLTVTVDGAKAKAGTLAETLTIAAKKDPSVTTSFQVTANIQ
jgi:uncharacterized protein DUF1573